MELLSFGDKGWGDEMVRAALMTLAVATASFALGLVLGSGVAALRLARSSALRGIGETYTTVLRAIPDLLIIYLLFFGSSQAMQWVAGWFGYHGYLELSPFMIGTIAIGFVSAAFSGEVIRGAVQAVPRGQIEAAKACGMPTWLRFRRILVPQVARYALPGLGNVWQVTLKETSLISVVGLVEIMRQASVAAGSTRQPFTFYAVAAVLYLVLTAGSNRMFGLADRWANRGVRRA